MRINKYLFLFLIAFSVALVLLLAFGVSRTSDKTAYVNIGEVYEAFELTKELNANYEKVRNRRQGILDSLHVQFQQLARMVNKEGRESKLFSRYEQLGKTLQYKEQEFTRDNEALMNDYNEQIMNQLNQYIADYGKDKGYDYIYGANGSGSLMYASDAHDISSQLIEYVNRKYEGK